MLEPTDPRAPALEPVSPEEERRADVSVAEMVEDHPDPAGQVKLWPLAEMVAGPEDVDGW
jgi:hypothetical protein